MNRDLLRKSCAVFASKRRKREAEGRLLAKLRRESWESGNQDGYRQRDKEFTKLIDPGDERSVWLTPKPNRDVLVVVPPASLATAYHRVFPEVGCSLVFRPRVIAECYDGVQYRQVLWERGR